MISIGKGEVDISRFSVKGFDNIGNSGFGNFDINIADELLKTTRQYDSWKSLRQKDPAKAARISRLILERHAYVAGTAPLDETGRRHFDDLTRRIASDGIHLYKSHQFKDPIFNATDMGKDPEGEIQKSGESNSPVNHASENLVRTSKLGMKFARKDCYEFLAGMLETNGIKYYGEGGVASTLIAKARGLGKNPYSFFNGEGVTELLCSKPVTIGVDKVSKDSLEEIWIKLEPHLKEGAILSYSSDRFGHTGIVGKENGNWVYVNSSGRRGDRSSYRILEEDLKSEVAGWLKRAAKKGTFLEITLGNIDRDMAKSFSEELLASKYSQGSKINLLA